MQVYQSPELRARLGEQNRASAEKLFSMRNAERTAQILGGLVEETRPYVPEKVTSV
jgi:hypothetical protein